MRGIAALAIAVLRSERLMRENGEDLVQTKKDEDSI